MNVNETIIKKYETESKDINTEKTNNNFDVNKWYFVWLIVWVVFSMILWYSLIFIALSHCHFHSNYFLIFVLEITIHLNYSWFMSWFNRIIMLFWYHFKICISTQIVLLNYKYLKEQPLYIVNSSITFLVSLMDPDHDMLKIVDQYSPNIINLLFLFQNILMVSYNMVLCSNNIHQSHIFVKMHDILLDNVDIDSQNI